MQNDQKLMFMPDNRNSGAKLVVEFKSIQGDTFIYVFVCVCVCVKVCVYTVHYMYL